MTNKTFIFIFSLFLISFLISCTSAVTVSQLQTASLSGSVGSADLQWDNTGNYLYAFDDCQAGATPNNLTIYYAPSQYDLSNLQISSTVNLTSLFPSTNLTAGAIGYNISNLSQGFNVVTAYMTRAGNNLYLVVSNNGCTWEDTNGIHSHSYIILHYTMTNFNVANAVLSEYQYYYGGEQGGGFSQFPFTYGSTYTIPQIKGIYINDNGNYLVIAGNYIANGVSDINPKIYTFNLTSPYSLAGMKNSTSFYGANVANMTYPFNISRITSNNYAFYSSLQVSPDNSFYVMTERKQHTSVSSTVSIGVASVAGGLKQDVVSGSSDFTSATIASSFTNLYLFAQSGGTLYKYQINDLTSQVNEAVNQTQAQQITTNLVSGFTGLFPDASTLSFAQKVGFTLAIMLITAIVILLASSSFSSGVNVIVLWIILLIEVMEFIYFISIGYVPIGVLITLLLFGAIVAYLFLRGGKH